MNDVTRILIVEDQPGDYELAQREISKSLKNCVFQRVETRKHFIEALYDFQPDLIVSDYSLPKFDGLKALHLAQEHAPLTPLIIWTGSIDEDTAVDCMKAGAVNYVLKENIKRLAPSVVHALKERKLWLARKKAEETIRDMCRFPEENPSPILRVTCDGKILYANPAGQQLLAQWNTAVGRELPAAWIAEVTSAYQTNKSGAIDVSMEAKDYSLLVVPITDAGYLNLYGSDVTQIKRNEAALRASEQELRTITENMNELICRFLPDGTLTYVNQVYCDYFRKTREELLGTSFVPLGQGDFPRKLIEHFQSLSPEKPLGRFEQFDVLSNGKKHWREWMDRAIFDEQGRLVEIQSTGRDITMRKEAEEKYQSIFENSPIGIFQSTPEGRFISVNTAMAQIFGYASPQEMIESVTDIGKQIYVDPNRRNQFVSALQTQSFIHGFEKRDRRKDGSSIWTSTSARTVQDAAGNILYFEGFLQDITARKEADARLMQSEKRFRALIENGTDNISLLSRNATLLWENPAVTRTLGYGQDAFVNHNIFELMHPDDLTWTQELFQEILQAPGNQRRGMFRLRHQNGSWRWVEATATNLLEEDAVQAVVVNYRDVTERKNAEDELRESQRKYKDLVETSHDLIWAVDANGNITFLNRAAKDIYGYEPQELIGHSFFELMDPGADHIDLETFREMISHADEYHAVESHVRHKAGHSTILSANSIVNRDEHGNIIGLTGSSRDITEQKLAQDKLRESEEKYRLLFESNPLPMWIYDLETLKFLKVNDAAVYHYGYSEQEFLSMTIKDIRPAEDISGLLADIANSHHGDRHLDRAGIWRHLKKDGTLLFVDIVSHPVEFDGRQAELILANDVTARRQTEAHINDLLEFNEKILNHSPLGILTYKITGECVFANQQAALIVGTNVETLRAQNFHLLDTWKKSGLYSLVQKTISSRSVQTGDFHVISSFGKDIWMTVHCVTFSSKDEEHLLLSISDITERKRAENAVLESETRLNLALAGAQMGVWEWNLQTNAIFWSPECFEIAGMRQEEFGGNLDALKNRLHPQDAGNVFARAAEAIANKALFTAEFRITRPDDEVRWLANLGQVEYDQADQPLRLIGTVQDITPRKRSELERQTFFEIMQAVVKTNDLQELLKQIHGAISNVIYAENFFVVLHHRETGLFEEIYSVDEYDPPAPPSTLERSVTSYVFRTGQPLLLGRESFNDLMLQHEVELIGTDSASWLGVPLKTSNGTIGVIAVQDYYDPNRYSEQDKDFLTSIASQVALAVERKQADIEIQQKNDDLTLLNTVNEAVVRGQKLDSTIELLSQELKRIFSSVGSTIYMVSPDKQSVTILQYTFSPEIADRIEKLLGFAIPKIEIPLKEGGYFHRVLLSRKATITTGPKEIHGWISEFVETKFLPPMAKKIVYRLIPQIYKLLNIKSIITVPLKSEQEVIGFLDVSSSRLFSVNDLKRIEHIGGQLSVVIQQQQANEKTRASEEQFRLLFENSGEAVFIIQTDGTILSANPEACRIFGRSEQAIKESGWAGIVDPNDTRLRAAVEERLRTGQFKGELAFRRKDGSTFTGEVATTVFKDSSGSDKTSMIVRDVTERRRVEENLRTSNERFNFISKAVNDAVWDWDLTTNRVSWNDAVQTLFKYRPEQVGLEADWWSENLHPDDRERIISSVDHIINSETTDHWKNEYRFRKADGSYAFVFDRGYVIRDESGKAIRMVGAMQDISERKQAEQDLRASEERFRQLADNIEEVFWITDAKTGEEVYISPAAQAVWGSSGEAIRRNPALFYDLIVPEDKAWVVDNVEKQRKGKRTEIEYRVIHPDGSVRWIWDRGFPIFDESGSVKTVAGIAADITERKQAEEELRTSEERYHGLFQNLVDGFALHEILTDDQGKPVDYIFLEVNPAFERLTGLEARHLIGQRVTEVLPGVENEHFIPIYGQVALTGQPIHFHEYSAPLGKYFEINAYSPRHGQFAVTFVDITQRKQAEEEIRRRAQETSALLATSQALTNLDLKTILQSIGSSAQSLFAADGCRIFLMQPDGRSLRCVLALQDDPETLSDLTIQLSEGVTGAVAASGRAEIVNEMQTDPRAYQVPGTVDEAEAIMFAPLKERERTIGVLSIRRAGAERPFEPADLELLEALASMAASAVSNARLYEEAQRRLAELEALYENGLAVGQLLEPHQIGERVIETFARHLSWHHVTIRLLYPETNQLELIAFNLPGLSDEERLELERHFNTMIQTVGQGLSGWVVQTGVAIRTGNVHSHSQYVDTQEGIESGLYMPLKIRERVIGVISVESESPEAFTEQDERLLATLANQAAVAFENARLYQAAQQEILERNRAQAALLTSESHYRQLADSIADILFEMDYDLRYTHWNKAAEMFSGIPAEDAIGRKLHEVWGDAPPENYGEEIYRSVLRDRQAKTFEIEGVLNQKKYALEINAYPSARGVSVVAKDVTKRKLDEALLQKRFELMEFSARHSLEELMQRTVDEVSELTDSHIGFMHFVEADQETVRMQAWSTETTRTLGRGPEPRMHYPMVSAGVWADALRQKQPIIHNYDETLPDKNGMPADQVQIERELVIPIVRDDHVVAVLGIGNKPQEYTPHDIGLAERFADYAWDITERKRMESILANERNQLARRVEERTADLSRANSNLARALRVKDEFLANMSHELRTPLNAILGLSESLSEQVAGPLNEKQQKYLNTINESGHHLLSLINDILDLAKIEAGQITLDINKVDINAVCQASLRMIKQLAQKKNQEVQFEMAEDIGLMWADERRLKQMIVNLLSNAVKFTPDSGRLGLKVWGDEAGNRIIITVWDNGIGIRKQDLDRLFKPFVQLDSGLAKETAGTGLGLALVAQMARLHGGSVIVESNPGEGSRFSIQLPWEPALAADASIRLRNTGKFRAIDPGATNRPTILIIEDTREVVMMLADYLEMSGFKIATAQDGIDGLAQAKLSHPNLILMDIMMPSMDGFETTRKLRMDPEFRDTPIIALTALAMPSDRQRCLDAGMDEYISKPVNLKALTKLIRSILLEKGEGKAP